MIGPLWRQFLLALGFLTRLPVAPPVEDWRGRLAAAAWAFPLVGLVVGGFGGAVWSAGHWLGLPLVLAALVAVAAQVLLTGALHEDGLADVADGFGGGRDRARKLEIMRDSQIGAYGVVALVLVLLARVAAVASLEQVLMGLLVAAILSRAAMALAMGLLPAARGDGLGHDASGVSAPAWAGVALAVVIAVFAVGFAQAFWVVFTAGIVLAFVCWRAVRHIGGQTGDVLGAVQQLVEAAVLLVLAAQ